MHFLVCDSDMISECVMPQQTVSGISTSENLLECQDSSLEKDDACNPASVSDCFRDHFRLRKLLVTDKSKHCNKVYFLTIFIFDIMITEYT